MPRVLGEARWPGSEGGHLDALCFSSRSPRSRRGSLWDRPGLIGAGQAGGPDPGPLTPGTAGEASPDTWAGAHRCRAGWGMGGPDPGPLTTRDSQGGLRGPAGHPGRGPSGKGSLEDGRARPGAPDPQDGRGSLPGHPGQGPSGKGRLEGPTRGP
ncbi:hypothetical protein NDU88_003060 [Pleurodeles waltl]|uniref:Uncharacterized protein n=1 Tax=Pleurodeles waltl TaxID=8319 RepID=A0AAV7P8H8_PLEWA|nr:hypothetical protein NDU88_003060 [Pleurodeles waltl]